MSTTPAPGLDSPAPAAGVLPRVPLRNKIAALPDDLRKGINERLQSGASATTILAWLNDTPEHEPRLRAFFGRFWRISPASLSKWRRGGFRTYLEQLPKPIRVFPEIARCRRVLKSGDTARLLDKLQTLTTAQESPPDAT